MTFMSTYRLELKGMSYIVTLRTKTSKSLYIELLLEVGGPIYLAF